MPEFSAVQEVFTDPISGGNPKLLKVQVLGTGLRIAVVVADGCHNASK
jgi:hypothetical protein